MCAPLSMLFLREGIFLLILIVIFIDDWRFMRIADRVTIPAMGISLMINSFFHLVSLESMVEGALMIGGFFLVQFLVSRGTWIGDGDIRLGCLMGIMLGGPLGLVALFLAYVGGALISLFLIAAGKVKRTSQIPFGVFLTSATAFTLWRGQELLDWYVGFFH